MPKDLTNAYWRHGAVPVVYPTPSKLAAAPASGGVAAWDNRHSVAAAEPPTPHPGVPTVGVRVRGGRSGSGARWQGCGSRGCAAQRWARMCRSDWSVGIPVLQDRLPSIARRTQAPVHGAASLARRGPRRVRVERSDGCLLQGGVGRPFVHSTRKRRSSETTDQPSKPAIMVRRVRNVCCIGAVSRPPHSGKKAGPVTDADRHDRAMSEAQLALSSRTRTRM